MTSSPRLRFALERLTSGDWLLFERFAAEFLVSEFPTLRTTANPSGDGGRDGELFIPNCDPRTGMQYSVTENWSAKIRKTAKDIDRNHSNLRRLIYCTSKEIGARSDKLREELWENFGLQLDVRDMSWFIDRESETSTRFTASAELAAQIVDPYLQSRQLIDNIASPITREDSKVALLQLSFRSRDGETQRGLTKTTFEALVLAALHNTTADSTRSENEIFESVRESVPGGSPGQVKSLVTSAISRLATKSGPVTRRADTGQYHISYQAAAEWNDATVEYLLNQKGLEEDLVAAAFGLSSRLDTDLVALEKEATVLREALESVLLSGGEKFVDAIEHGNLSQLSEEQLANDLAALEMDMSLSSNQAATAIMRVLLEPSERSKTHLIRVLEAYTLFAFLQATPDVQKSLSRVFAGGEIWLDASAVLPLIGELFIPDPQDRSYTLMLTAARESGVKLYITDGMIEEVERHLNLCITFSNTNINEWRNRVPFVYASYTLSGRAESSFPEWLKDICGDLYPQEDVAIYLQHNFGIARKNLLEQANEAPVELRGTVQELWLQSHEARRARGVNGLDPSIVARLVEHDVENVVGVMMLRRSNPMSPLGHTAWWLTLDSTAFKLPSFLRNHLGPEAPKSPVLSPDFLVQMLRFGPLRRHVEGEHRDLLPLGTDISRIESVPKELIELARKVRLENANFSEIRIQREVRDALEHARSSISNDSRTYSQNMREDVHDAIRASRQ